MRVFSPSDATDTQARTCRRSCISWRRFKTNRSTGLPLLDRILNLSLPVSLFLLSLSLYLPLSLCLPLTVFISVPKAGVDFVIINVSTYFVSRFSYSIETV